jgi:hypothetical protein
LSLAPANSLCVLPQAQLCRLTSSVPLRIMTSAYIGVIRVRNPGRPSTSAAQPTRRRQPGRAPWCAVGRRPSRAVERLEARLARQAASVYRGERRSAADWQTLVVRLFRIRRSCAGSASMNLTVGRLTGAMLVRQARMQSACCRLRVMGIHLPSVCYSGGRGFCMSGGGGHPASMAASTFLSRSSPASPAIAPTLSRVLGPVAALG